MSYSKILRRESFGGLLVHPASGGITILDSDDFEREEENARLRPGEVRAVDVTAAGWPLRSDALSSPASAYIEVTRRCDAACRHCYADAALQGRHDAMTFGELTGLLCALAEAGAWYIRLTGGEPTLRPDLLDLLEVIRGHGMRPSLNTHGRYGEETLRGLIEHGLQDFRVSLDGTEEVNDHLRGPGAYREVVATLRTLAEHNRTAVHPVDVTVNVVLMRANRHCLRPLAALAAELGVRISFGLLRPMGRADRDQMLSPPEVLAAAHEANQLRRTLGLTAERLRINYDIYCSRGPQTQEAFQPFPLDNTRCPIATQGIGVRADGRLVPCVYLARGHLVGEDVRDRDVLEIWHRSSLLNGVRASRRRGCDGCPHLGRHCNAGCPACALVVSEDLDGRDPYCVRDVDPAALGLPPFGGSP